MRLAIFCAAKFALIASPRPDSQANFVPVRRVSFFVKRHGADQDDEGGGKSFVVLGHAHDERAPKLIARLYRRFSFDIRHFILKLHTTRRCLCNFDQFCQNPFGSVVGAVGGFYGRPQVAKNDPPKLVTPPILITEELV